MLYIMCNISIYLSIFLSIYLSIYLVYTLYLKYKNIISCKNIKTYMHYNRYMYKYWYIYIYIYMVLFIYIWYYLYMLFRCWIFGDGCTAKLLDITPRHNMARSNQYSRCFKRLWAFAPGRLFNRSGYQSPTGKLMDRSVGGMHIHV